MAAWSSAGSEFTPRAGSGARRGKVRQI
ncbi:hypothetical protein NGA_0427002, partial [Nannochloropsis gaditana CCMP526]